MNKFRIIYLPRQKSTRTMPSSASRSFSVDRDRLSALSLPDFRSFSMPNPIFLSLRWRGSFEDRNCVWRKENEVEGFRIGSLDNTRSRGRSDSYARVDTDGSAGKKIHSRQKLGYEPRAEELTVLSSKSEKYISSLTKYIFENVIHLGIQLVNWAILRRNPATLKIRTNQIKL